MVRASVAWARTVPSARAARASTRRTVQRIKLYLGALPTFPGRLMVDLDGQVAVLHLPSQDVSLPHAFGQGRRGTVLGDAAHDQAASQHRPGGI
ncbi:hypothetical protein [Deinococcus aestuarii]|uniref:hypothetical protein n=1 Tax=Deinococcus aestuarii TaxID=2774531 RepID=UPI001C0B1840